MPFRWAAINARRSIRLVGEKPDETVAGRKTQLTHVWVTRYQLQILLRPERR
jgi:hypothetical protein